MSVGIFGRLYQMIHVISIACILKVDICRCGCRLSTIASVMHHLTFFHVLIFCPTWLKASQGFHHLFLLLPIFFGYLKFALPFVHIFIVKGWWVHIFQSVYQFVSLVRAFWVNVCFIDLSTLRFRVEIWVKRPQTTDPLDICTFKSVFGCLSRVSFLTQTFLTCVVKFDPISFMCWFLHQSCHCVI